jgi:hypothetical protein
MQLGGCASERASPRSRPEVADIVREHGDELRRTHALRPEQAVALRAIVQCRTAALGGHVDVCDGCGFERPSYNSCRNRHCPKCQSLAQARWVEERRERILPIAYFHVVFTLPAELHRLARARSERVYDLLFRCAADALLELAADPKRLGARLGITAVLHTWSRELAYHPHVHCIVTGGGLSLEGDQWVRCRRDYLLSVHALGALFRGKMLAALRRDCDEGIFRPEDVQYFERVVDTLYRKPWVVYAKRPFGGAEQVVRYLGRYTHRIGLSNQRIVAIDDDGATFRTKNGKAITLDGVEFLRRFVQHVLPPGFTKIRHYGLLASRNVPTSLPLARQLIAEAQPTRLEPGAILPTEVRLDWRALLLALTGIDLRPCPHCGAQLIPRPLPRGPPRPRTAGVQA